MSRLPRPVWVREGRIEAVGEAALAIGSDRPRQDQTGRFLVPGLIDAHVHLELDPALRSPAEQLARTPEQIESGMAARARAMLHAGITTARDCGGGAFREHALRDQIRAGAQRGPRLLCCGQPLTSKGGHCHFWGGEVEREVDAQAVVDRNVRAGSDWIKVMATGGVFTPGSRARDTQFEPELLARFVARASEAGRFVAAHCHGTRGIRDALAAGVRTIEHASFAGKKGFGVDLDHELMRELAARTVWVSPTVNAGWGRRIRDEKGSPTVFFERMSRCLRAQREAGVRFIASTDAGIPNVEHDALVAGLLAFETFAGLTPAEVLETATRESAKALGLEDETGQIEAGLSADLLLLNDDPTADLRALEDPEVVVFRGEWLSRAARGKEVTSRVD